MTEQSHEPNPGRPVRCPYCDSMLLRVLAGDAVIEVQCRRCKAISTHHVGGPPAHATNADLVADALRNRPKSAS